MSKGWAAIARLGGIGDNLIAGSPLRALKRMGYQTEMITSPPFHTVYHHNPYIDKLTVKVPERDLPQNDQLAWQKWFEARAQEYEIFAHLSHSCEVRHACFPGSTMFYWPAEYRRAQLGGSYLETAHDIVGAPHDFGPLYFVSEEEKQEALKIKAQVGDKCIGWVICGTRLDKMYPYAALAIQRITQELKIPVIMFGSSSEKEYSSAEAIKAHVERSNGNRKLLHSAVPATQLPDDQKPTIRTALALLHQCDLVVAPDTGPAWAVAMEQLPKVIKVSHASAENITKHWVNTTTLHADPDRVPCWPCHRLHDKPDTCVANKEGNGAACISDIGVDRLLAAVDAAWNKKGTVQYTDNSRFYIGDPLVREQMDPVDVGNIRSIRHG